MRFQRSPATPKSNPAARPPSSSPASSAAAAFSRSLGVYFPRSSAQVQPRPPPDAAQLLRLVQNLQESESRLQTQLLEYKLLNESASIVPLLESQLASRDRDLLASQRTVEHLTDENDKLRRRVGELEAGYLKKEERIRELEEEVEVLRRTVSDEQRRRCSDDCLSSQRFRFQGLIDASSRSNLLKCLRKSPKSVEDADVHQEAAKTDAAEGKGDPREIKPPSPPPPPPSPPPLHSKPRPPRVPNPPPTRSQSNSSTSSPSSSSTSGPGCTASSTATESPLPSAVSRGGRAPPPPPPPPPRGRNCGVAPVRRVPEVVEFYHSLMRRDSKREPCSNAAADAPAAGSARDMIGEIENRSAHLLAIKSDVETQGDFIRFLIKEVENAEFSNMEDVVAFVKWLDEELSFLVDERAVLKHFDWPEKKADAMREAAFGYYDLKKLELETSLFPDDHSQPCASALKKMQVLLEKLEQGVYNLAGTREGAGKKYKGFHIPCEWMQDAGLIHQIKLASVKLAMKYMKRVTSEIEGISGFLEEEDLMLQGVRFAFRVHQFAGGFDTETMRAFQELKGKARNFRVQSQSLRHNQQPKMYCRSTTC